MMSKFTARTVLATFAGLVFSAGAQAAPSMADALFEKTANAANLAPLSAADREAIARLLPFKMFDGKVVDEFCKKEVLAESSMIDLNEDRQPEVVIIGGNTCSDGTTGASLYLLGKFGQEWRLLLNSLGIDYWILKTHGIKGWSDITVGGRGFCFPRFRFNGTKYIPAGGTDDKGRVCKP